MGSPRQSKVCERKKRKPKPLPAMPRAAISWSNCEAIQPETCRAFEQGGLRIGEGGNKREGDKGKKRRRSARRTVHHCFVNSWKAISPVAAWPASASCAPSWADRLSMSASHVCHNLAHSPSTTFSPASVKQSSPATAQGRLSAPPTATPREGAAALLPAASLELSARRGARNAGFILSNLSPHSRHASPQTPSRIFSPTKVMHFRLACTHG